MNILMTLIVVPIVILVFKFIPDKQMAGVVAGSIFILMSLFLSLLFKKLKGTRILGLLFLILIAMPMFVTRVVNYGVDFNELKVFWIEGPVFHKLANYAFLILLIGQIIEKICMSRRIESGKA